MPTPANNEIIDAIQSGVNSANEVNLIPKPMDSVVQTGDIIIDVYQQDGGTFGAVIADGAGIFVGGAVAATLGTLVVKAALMTASIPGYGPGIAIWILYEGQAIVLEVSNSVSDFVANQLLEDLRSYSRDDLREDISDWLNYFDDLFGSSGDPTPVSDAIADPAQWFRDNFLTPLVFQLSDGLSLQLTQLENSPTFFDLDADGFKEQVGWTTQEGFLVVDRNGNGVIDSQAEMFGADATGSAWDKLRVYDTSRNGVVSGTERDALRIWIDANGNGTSEASELKTLQQAGIASINLTQKADHFWVGDHEINGGGSFTKTSGGTGKYYDVYFKTNQLNSWYVGTDTTTPPANDNVVDAISARCMLAA